MYYVYGFMLLVFIILAIVTVCVTIVGTYFLLNAENYHWQWTSFCAAASTSLCVPPPTSHPMSALVAVCGNALSFNERASVPCPIELVHMTPDLGANDLLGALRTLSFENSDTFEELMAQQPDHTLY